MKPGVRMSFVVSMVVRLDGRGVVGAPEEMEETVPFSMRMLLLRIISREDVVEFQVIAVPPASSVAALVREEPRVRLRSVGRCILVLSWRCYVYGSASCLVRALYT